MGGVKGKLWEELKEVMGGVKGKLWEELKGSYGRS